MPRSTFADPKNAYVFGRILAGIAIQNERGALVRAEKRALRRGVEAFCRALGIELTEERKREIERLDVAGPEALLGTIEERRGWV